MKKILLLAAAALTTLGSIEARAASATTGPTPDDRIIDTTPAGTLKTYVKAGSAYGYSQFAGLMSFDLAGSVSNVVISDDRTKIYIQKPVYYYADAAENWIEGTLADGVATFTFPQYTSLFVDGAKIYRGYTMCFTYVAAADDPENGWYYPAEQQTYRFSLEEDGTLKSIESPELMIGQAAWISGDKLPAGQKDPYWAWQGNGDFISTITPVEARPAILPDGIEMQDWQLFSELTSRKVSVGVNGDKLYIVGLNNIDGLEEVAVQGTITDAGVVFESGQYMGVYAKGGTTTYFVGGKAGDDSAKTFTPAKSITFAYDKENNILSCPDDYCVSVLPDNTKRYYVLGEKPYLCIPAKDAVVKSIPAPQTFYFYDVDEDSNWDSEFYFYMPTIDTEHNVLDTSRLFYEVFINNKLFTFYDDEYVLPEGLTEMTQVPYGYGLKDSGFTAQDNINGFVLHLRGYDSLGVRAVYKPEGSEPICSPMLWAPGYVEVESTTAAGKEVRETIYHDLCGMRVAHPAAGIFIERTVYTDGTVKTRKVVVK